MDLWDDGKTYAERMGPDHRLHNCHGPMHVEKRRDESACGDACKHECSEYWAVCNAAGDVIAEVFNELDAERIRHAISSGW